MSILKTNCKILIVATCVTFVPVAATEGVAQETMPGSAPVFGPYVTMSFSLAGAEDAGTSAGFEAEYGYQYGFDLGFGYTAGPLRAEAVLFAQRYELFDINPDSGSGIPAVQYGGWLNLGGVMANVFLDFDISPRVRPYVGVGGGYGYVEAVYSESDCVFACGLKTELVDDDDTVKLWQYMAGITILPSGQSDLLEVFLGYRQFRSTDMRFTLADGTPFQHDGMKAHIVEFGVRLRFP